MLVQSTNAQIYFGDFTAVISSFFVKIIENSVMARSAEVRSEQIAALNAKSDAELAAMRLNRSDIALHVFRDRLYI
jgi:F0F1-type ATP synthase membrane subunit b/b'